MVFELYGCPGVGKSTVVKNVEALLKDKEIDYMNYNAVFFNGKKSLLYRMVNYSFALLNPRYCSVNFHILRACLQFRSNLKYAVYLMTLIERIKAIEQKNEGQIMILDEGIIQFVSSIAHGKDISTSSTVLSLLDQIQKLGIKIKAIECTLPLNENIKRLTERKQHSRFLLAENQNEIIRLLVIKKNNVDYVASHFEKLCTLDMSKSSMDNSLLLFDTIIAAVTG